MPAGLALGTQQHQTGSFASNTGAEMNPQPAICPDEGLVYLNTGDWTMLLDRKLFGMRNFPLYRLPSGIWPVSDCASRPGLAWLECGQEEMGNTVGCGVSEASVTLLSSEFDLQ